ncbi:lysozyme inhibitor LprI family protein [Labrys neptuniae]
MKGSFLFVAAILTSLSASAAQAADYAPLDCAKAASSAEKAVCGSYALGQVEARMATLYGVSMSLVAMGQRGDIGEAQQAWLKTREACGADIACLDKVYAERIGRLDEVIRNIASHGPF